MLIRKKGNNKHRKGGLRRRRCAMHRREKEIQWFEEMSDQEDSMEVDIDNWLEDDEISGEEEGFMRGYLIDEKGDDVYEDTEEYD